MADNISFIPSPFGNENSFLENCKNQLLAAVYAGDWETVESVFSKAHRFVSPMLEHNGSSFSENDEKLLNQILVFFNTFHARLTPHCSQSFFKSLQQLKSLMLSHVRNAGKKSISVSFKKWQDSINLSPEQMQFLFKTAMNFQLSTGCSNFCRRCNEWALPKVRDHFTFDAIFDILGQISQQGNTEISLYGASDPLDWQENGKTIADIVAKVPSTLEYSLLTKAPKGKLELLHELIQSHANISVSMTARNKARIKALEERLKRSTTKQHDTDGLLIPACLDEDFTTVKPSITDGYGTEITPGGAFIIIPTFTSALHPFGHKKISVSRDTQYFPMKKTGRRALLVDYFKPLEVYNLNKNRLHLDHLLSVQVESILLDSGHDDLTPPGMRSVKEYFSIFEEKARLQRKKMTVSVIKKLKRQYLDVTRFADLSQRNKTIYLRKIQAHLDLCNSWNCLDARKNTAAFFLSQIATYLSKNTDKTIIVQYLLKDEIASQSNLTNIQNQDISNLFLDEATNAFALFRQLALQMVVSQCLSETIKKFIQDNPAVYDPLVDIFILEE